MKIKNRILSLAIVSLVLAACSGQKKEEKAEEVNTYGTHEMPAEKIKTPIVAFENVDPKINAQLQEFLAAYFELNKVMMTDDQKIARGAAQKLSETVAKFDMTSLTAEQMDVYLNETSNIKEGLAGIAATDDIEKIRTELATVSEGMYVLTKAFHPNQTTLYYQFCPMARNGQGANWLSSTKEIVNPYMGRMMPECGKTEETLQ